METSHFGDRRQGSLNLHTYELAAIELLEQGERLTVEAFGGVSSFLEAVDELCVSPLMPEFLRISVSDEVASDQRWVARFDEFVCRCLEADADALNFAEAVELIDGGRPLALEASARCFKRLQSLAATPTECPMRRSIALEAAFRWAKDDRSRQLTVLRLLYDMDPSDSSIFLARAVKIIGLAGAIWNETGLREKLTATAGIDGICDEACYELGFALLRDGLEAPCRSLARDAFIESRNWFKRAAESREQRPDAIAMVHCLDALTAFSEGYLSSEIARLSDAASFECFQVVAWHLPTPRLEWLGCRQTEITCWSMLATKLGSLSAHIREPSWWEPALVIEQHLLVIYELSHTVLGRASEGGMQILMRPRICAALKRHEGQAYAIRQWLSRNTGSPWAAELSSLLGGIEAVSLLDDRDSSVEELLNRITNSSEARQTVVRAVANTLCMHINNRTDCELALLETCVQKATSIADYTENLHGRRLFDSVLLLTLRFLASRLEMTRADDPGIEYLFERSGRELPPERDLRDDYFRFMYANLSGSEIELSNVGGGRADVHFRSAGERFVTEVKRESGECSFDRLASAYAAQATDYQNVSVRLGILLVLDQSESRIGGTPHMSTLVQAREVQRSAEPTPRLLVIVKVPGRRFRPSDLTKLCRR